MTEHIVAHIFDFSAILQNDSCDERLAFPFSSPSELAHKMKILWNEAADILEHMMMMYGKRNRLVTCCWKTFWGNAKVPNDVVFLK